MVDKKKKTGLAKRYQSSYENKGSIGKAGIMDYKKLDNDIEFYSPKQGKNRINIIPYVIKTKNHPLVRKGEFEIGEKDYVMDVYVHRGVGPAEASVICLKETYGKPCPICEQASILKKQGKEKEAGALKPSRRVFYNVQDTKEPEKLKIFETSHYLFERELIDEARDDDEGGFVDFADERNGKEIKFRCEKVSKGGMEFNEFKSFNFESRDEEIPDDLIENAVSFDEIMIVPTYDEVEKVLYGSDDDEPEVKSKSKSKSDDDDDDDDDDDEPEVKSKSKSKSKSDDDDDDDDDDDEPEVKSKSKVDGSKHKCPFGHKFGDDVDEYSDCDECDIWDKCVNGK